MGFHRRSTSRQGTQVEADTEIVQEAEKKESLMDKFDKWGLALKPMALKAKSDALESTQKWMSYLFTVKFCGILCLFIAYRAYRGFFIILPQVFREVERKLSQTMNYAPFIDDDISTVTNKIDARIRGEPSSSDLAEDIDPKTGLIRPRTTITVTLLAGMVTACYMVRGALGVIVSLLKTGFMKKDIRKGFEAAADEVIANEGRIMRVVEQNADSN
ncbi:hypothetical protein TrVE_jg6731 [Triparma verrucosa]|nr:hypothetical protein TrVE_jg6731 [Triparma verrucosa]